MKRHFKTSLKKSLSSSLDLQPYRTYERAVRSVEHSKFTAVHHEMHCPEHGKFRVEGLVNIVARGCTYVNDVMVEAAKLRFLNGRSSPEISGDLEVGISDRHVTNVSNLALSIFREIHADHEGAIGKRMSSYILQIDSTVDSESAMKAAIEDVFPKVPGAVCRFHLLRDLGKDMMESMHISLGKIISDSRIRSKLRESMESFSDWSDSMASEIGSGF